MEEEKKVEKVARSGSAVSLMSNASEAESVVSETSGDRIRTMNAIDDDVSRLEGNDEEHGETGVTIEKRENSDVSGFQEETWAMLQEDTTMTQLDVHGDDVDTSPSKNGSLVGEEPVDGTGSKEDSDMSGMTMTAITGRTTATYLDFNDPLTTVDGDIVSITSKDMAVSQKEKSDSNMDDQMEDSTQGITSEDVTRGIIPPLVEVSEIDGDTIFETERLTSDNQDEQGKPNTEDENEFPAASPKLPL